MYLYTDRLRYYHLLQEGLRRNKDNIMYIRLNYYILKIQKILKVDRLKGLNLVLKKGSNWFSITHECASFIVNNFDKYKKMFKFSSACDELFIHTILENEINNFKIYKSSEMSTNLRKIDWVRGRPYVWTCSDYNELISSSELWARKFDYNTDREIIDLICSKINQ